MILRYIFYTGKLTTWERIYAPILLVVPPILTLTITTISYSLFIQRVRPIIPFIYLARAPLTLMGISTLSDNGYKITKQISGSESSSDKLHQYNMGDSKR